MKFIKKKITNPRGEIGWGLCGRPFNFLSESSQLVFNQIQWNVERTRTYLYDLHRSIQEELINNEVYQKKDN